jgi:hypothetical protein
MSKETSTSEKIGFLGLLTILFIALKLMHYIDWDWFWVLSPLVIPVGIVIIVCLFMLLIAFCIWVYTSIEK